MDDDSATSNPKSAPPRRRGRLVLLVAASVIVVAVLAGAGLLFFDAHLTFAYEGPSEAVPPGGAVEIKTPDVACGPLIVSLRSPSILGQWNQTHSGNAINDAFSPDEKTWWSLSSGSIYVTPVPCRINGTIRFTLPTDVKGRVVAACDSDRRCAKVQVDQSGDG